MCRGHGLFVRGAVRAARLMFGHWGMARTVDELFVYQKAFSAARALDAILSASKVRKDCDLSRQLNRAAVRIVSNIAEGFEQKTDRHFARYLYDARGSTSEIRAQLSVAVDRALLSEPDRALVSARFEELARMLTGLIQYLEREDRKQRR